MLINQASAKELLAQLYHFAVASALPKNCIPSSLPQPPKGKVVVIGFGKASAAMAHALEQAWPGIALQGTVVTRYGHAKPCKNIRIIEAAHPNPDENSVQAANLLLTQVQNLSPEDLVICLISGGGSSLLCLPCAGLKLSELQTINRQLLACGASIDEINCIRRHLSAIKGGRLALACYPAKVLNLIISDVPGDDLHNIASGPTVADPSTCNDALEIIYKYKLSVPEKIIAMLKSGSNETIKPNNKIFNNINSKIIASPKLALQAAAKLAEDNGIKALILSDSIEGEAREVGKVLANIASQIGPNNNLLKYPYVILSGGETTVTINGNGTGGSNVELILSSALALNGKSNIYALAADTDGIDGAAEIAGAFIAPNTLKKAQQLGLSAQEHLDNNDAHSFFTKLNDSFITGPTYTNVNDFRAFLVISTN